MVHINNKIEWCLKKAEKEIKEGKKHRGLIFVGINLEEVKKHLSKSEHNLLAVTYFNKGGFSDWSMSAVFYCIYHCFLAIAYKFGYESRNQECTVSLIKLLREESKIEFDSKFIEALEVYEESGRHESSIIEKREFYTYGTTVSSEDKEEFSRSLSLCKECLEKTKNIVFK